MIWTVLLLIIFPRNRFKSNKLTILYHEEGSYTTHHDKFWTDVNVEWFYAAGNWRSGPMFYRMISACV